MRALLTAILTVAASVTHALASGSSGASGVGLLWNLFIAFGVMIVVFQFTPGITLLGGMVKGLFSLHSEKAAGPDVASSSKRG